MHLGQLFRLLEFLEQGLNHSPLVKLLVNLWGQVTSQGPNQNQASCQLQKIKHCY